MSVDIEKLIDADLLNEYHQGIVGLLADKADIVDNAVQGNFPSFDSEGNLEDSGKKPGDFLTQHQDISGKMDKIATSCVAYGRCATAAATAAKVVTIQGTKTGWTREIGSLIAIYFENTNTAQNPTLNVNDTGDYPVWYNTGTITTGNLGYAGTASRALLYMFYGSGYVFLGWSYDANSTYNPMTLGGGYGTCATAAATAAKEATLSGYTLVTGGIVAIKFTNAVPASATLNINAKGAKSIYYKNAAIAANVIQAGDLVTFIYSSQYHIIAIDRMATADSAYSSTSLNAVQNKVVQARDTVIKTAVNAIINKLKHSAKTITKTNTTGNITIYGSLVGYQLNQYQINAATYTPTITYNNYIYLILGTISNTDMEVVFPGSGSTAVGTLINLGVTLYTDSDSYCDSYLYKQSSSQWYLFNSRMRVSSTATTKTITLSKNVGFIPIRQVKLNYYGSPSTI